jgi:hypothetical protein
MRRLSLCFFLVGALGGCAGDTLVDSSGTGGAGGATIVCDASATCSQQSCGEGCEVECEPSTLLCPEARFSNGGLGGEAQSIADPEALRCVLEMLRDADAATQGRLYWYLDTSGTMGQSGQSTTLYLQGDRSAYVVRGSSSHGGAPSGGGDATGASVVGPVDLASPDDYQQCLALSAPSEIYNCIEQATARSCS